MAGTIRKLTLWRHSSGKGDTADTITAEVSSTRPGVYRIRYRVAGNLTKLHIPRRARPERANELWRHTCFEFFVTGSGTGYYEFNFSTSTQWAAYRFSSYRDGMTDLPLPTSPRIDCEISPDRFVLDAIVDLQALHRADVGSQARIALAAVIENRDGHIAYWALAHPEGKPDFHHADGFIAGLPDNSV